MYDFGFDWTDDEREQIIEAAKEVLSKYRVIKRRSIKMLETPEPDIKSPTFSDMPRSQNLANSSEERMVHYLAAIEEANELKVRCQEIERAINACHGEYGVYIRILTLRYIEGKKSEIVCNEINFGETWYYEKGLDEALCLFAETWDFGRLPRETLKRRKRGEIAEKLRNK